MWSTVFRRAQGSVNATEDVRLRAVELVCCQGWTIADAAEAVGYSRRAVETWLAKSNRGRQKSALKSRKPPGAKPKLDAAQQRRLTRLLDKGPLAAGFESQLWTGPRVGELIEREFGVTYHPRYLPSLLRSLGWTVQKPKRRASERNEEAITHWVRRDWPRIKKKPVG